MIYVQVGLYAEGPSDYDFLLPLLDRLVDDLLASHYPGEATTQPSPLPLDAATATKSREHRIAEVLVQYQETIQILVVHADADGDPARARRERVDPGSHRGQALLTQRVEVVGCIPVQAIEAWMLADPQTFRSLLGHAVELPRNPEALGRTKLKPTLQSLLQVQSRRRLKAAQFFGEKVSLDELRRLSAFQAFEAELLEALHAIARRLP